jgi:hypothetical protein
LSLQSFLSSDFCDTATSFDSLIQQPSSQFCNNPSELERDGYWFHYLEDKITAYLLSVEQQAPALNLFCRETDVMQLYQCWFSQRILTALLSLCPGESNWYWPKVGSTVCVDS